MAESGRTNSIAPVCATSFRAMLVGGFGGGIEEVEEAAWNLGKMLYNYSERQRHTHYRSVVSLVNRAQYLSKVPEEDIAKIHEFIIQSGRCPDGITCAIFAHSHGAKIVAEALYEDRLLNYLKQNTHIEEEATKRAADIRSCLAVFAIGGIDRISSKSAKIVRNMRLETDAKSFFGEKVFGRSTDKDTEIEVVRKDMHHENGGSKVSDKRSVNEALQTGVTHAKDPSTSVNQNGQGTETTASSGFLRTAKSKFWDGWGAAKEWIPHMQAVSTGQVKHVLSDYMYTDNVMQLIINALALDSDMTCGCTTGAASCSTSSNLGKLDTDQCDNPNL